MPQPLRDQLIVASQLRGVTLSHLVREILSNHYRLDLPAIKRGRKPGTKFPRHETTPAP